MIYDMYMQLIVLMGRSTKKWTDSKPQVKVACSVGPHNNLLEIDSPAFSVPSGDCKIPLYTQTRQRAPARVYHNATSETFPSSWLRRNSLTMNYPQASQHGRNFV